MLIKVFSDDTKPIEVYKELVMARFFKHDFMTTYKGEDLNSKNIENNMKKYFEECKKEQEKISNKNLFDAATKDELTYIENTLKYVPLILNYIIERGKSVIEDENKKMFWTLNCLFFYNINETNLSSIKIASEILLIIAKMQNKSNFNYQEKLDEIIYNEVYHDYKNINMYLVEYIVKNVIEDKNLYDQLLLKEEINDTMNDIKEEITRKRKK